MDVEYFGLMVLRGIGQAGLPVTEIKQMMKDNSMLNVKTADNSQFLIKIVKFEPESDISLQGNVDRERNNKDSDLYSDIFKRLNLQTIGYFIKEEGNLNGIHCTSFAERDSDAEKALKEK